MSLVGARGCQYQPAPAGDIDKETSMRKFLIALFLLAAGLPVICNAAAVPAYLVNTSGMTTFDQALVNRGNLYEVDLTTASLADGTSMWMLIDLATTAFTSDEIHISFEVASGSDSFVYVCDSGTVYSSGTAIVPFDKNFVTASAATAQFYRAPFVSSYGVVKSTTFVCGSQNSSSVGGYYLRGSEYVLDAGRIYLIGVKNVSGGAKAAGITVNFYEVDY